MILFWGLIDRMMLSILPSLLVSLNKIFHVRICTSARRFHSCHSLDAQGSFSHSLLMGNAVLPMFHCYQRMQCIPLCTRVKVFPWGRYQEPKWLDQRDCTFKVFIDSTKLPSTQSTDVCSCKQCLRAHPFPPPSLTLDIIGL